MPVFPKLINEEAPTNKIEECFSKLKLWNNAPKQVKEAKSITAAKKEIKSYCKYLPV